MKKILKFLLWSFVSLITLVALLYAWIDWSGNRAWKKVEAELIAKGEPLRIEQIIPPPIPDEQNFAFSPFFEGVFETEASTENGMVVHRPKLPKAIARLDALRLPKNPPKLSRSMGTAPLDLVAWQKYFRANPEFQRTASVGVPAAEIVGTLGKWRAPLDEIARNLRSRPLMRAPLHYELNFAMTLPHFTGINELSKLYQLRAIAHIRQGTPAEAFSDLESLLLLRKVAEPRQTLIGYMAATTTTYAALAVIREGLAAHAWDEDDLTNLSVKLELLNSFSDCSAALRAERVVFLEAMRRIPEFFQVSPGFTQEAPGWWKQTLLGIMSLPPRGLWERDRATYSRLTQQTLEKVLDQKEERIHLSAYRNYEAELSKLKKFPAWLGSLQTVLTLPYLDAVGRTAAQSSAYISQARIAIALERYRAKQGTLPENLNELAPVWIPEIPHDPIDGNPLRYKKVSETSYRIWSIGYDEKDGGGVAGAKNTEGDWTWESLPPQ